MSYEEMARWNIALTVGLLGMWITWAFLLWDDVQAWKKSRADNGIIVGCLCKTRHKAGDCPRDKRPQD